MAMTIPMRTKTTIAHCIQIQVGGIASAVYSARSRVLIASDALRIFA